MKRFIPCLFAASLTLLASCSPNSTQEPAKPLSTTGHQPRLSAAHRAHWFKGFSATGQQLATELSQSAEQLHHAIEAFLQQPNQENRQQAQQHWRNVYEQFQTMQPMQPYLTSIAPPNQLQHITKMDQWPIIPGYIDSIPGYPHSGIVNDVTVTLDLNTVIAQHSPTDVSEASFGLHVIEFFLWGASPKELKPLQQFHKQAHWNSPQQQPITQHPNNRRRQYLLLVSQQLRATCRQINSLWGLPKSTSHASLALKSLHQTLGEIRKDLHLSTPTKAKEEQEEFTFSGTPHHPMAWRIEALLHLLADTSPLLQTSSTNPQHAYEQHNPFSQKASVISKQIKQILGDAEFKFNDPHWLNKLDFTLAQLETSLYNAIAPSPVFAPPSNSEGRG